MEPSDCPQPQVFFEGKIYRYLHLNPMLVEPGIAKIYAVGQDKGYNFLVIDYLGKAVSRQKLGKLLLTSKKAVQSENHFDDRTAIHQSH